MAAKAPTTVVLHIGMPKTASSAIQYALARHRILLSELGVHYARPDADPRFLPGGISSGNGVALGLHLNPEKWPETYDPAVLEDAFGAAYVSAEHPISLISSEALAGAKHTELVRFKARMDAQGHAVRVIAFVRDLYDHAHASWVQRVKRGAYSDDFGTFCNTAYDNPQYRTLRIYRKVFGSEAMTVLHYDSAKDDVMAAFLAALGLPGQTLPAPPRVNPGLSAGEIEMLRRLNRLHRSPALARRLSDDLISRGAGRSSLPVQSPALAAALAERHGDEVKWINDRLLRRRHTLRIAGDADLRVPAGGTSAQAAVWADVALALGRVSLRAIGASILGRAANLFHHLQPRRLADALLVEAGHGRRPRRTPQRNEVLGASAGFDHRLGQCIDIKEIVQ
jgi:hypothetical protein